jgi:hypothetical protein
VKSGTVVLMASPTGPRLGTVIYAYRRMPGWYVVSEPEGKWFIHGGHLVPDPMQGVPA